MAYINGSANSFADLKTALDNACIANGWVMNSGILSKNGNFIRFDNVTLELYIRCGTSQTGSTLNDPAGLGVKISTFPTTPINFPVNYDIHIFSNPDEIYLIVNYNSSFYQMLSFGKSNVPGIGNGSWITGTCTAYADPNNGGLFAAMSVSSYAIEFTQVGRMLGGLFFGGGTSDPNYANSFVHTSLDSAGWKIHNSNTSAVGALFGANYCAGLMTSLPTRLNNATILVPIKAIQIRNNKGLTIVASPVNARYCRIDNLNPGEIVTFGNEQWKVYPFFSKNIDIRNGRGGNLVDAHSGTFGYAIRYTGG